MENKYYIDNNKLTISENDEKFFWIELIKPNQQEIDEILTKYKIPKDYIYSVLDNEEVPRVEVWESGAANLFLLSHPVKINNCSYITRPLSMIMVDGILITVSTESLKLMNKVKNSYEQKDLGEDSESLSTEIAWAICSEFVKSVRELNESIEKIERTVLKNSDERAFSDMIAIQKSLIKFSMATRENGPVIEKMFESYSKLKSDKASELLHDLLVENKQARVMIEESTTIMENLSDLYSNLISHKLNVVMQVLTSITIVMTVPTIVGGLWGMNVKLPIENHPAAFWILVLLSMVISWYIVRILKKKGYL